MLLFSQEQMCWYWIQAMMTLYNNETNFVWVLVLETIVIWILQTLTVVRYWIVSFYQTRTCKLKCKTDLRSCLVGSEQFWRLAESMFSHVSLFVSVEYPDEDFYPCSLPVGSSSQELSVFLGEKHHALKIS